MIISEIFSWILYKNHELKVCGRLIFSKNISDTRKRFIKLGFGPMGRSLL